MHIKVNLEIAGFSLYLCFPYRPTFFVFGWVGWGNTKRLHNLIITAMLFFSPPFLISSHHKHVMIYCRTIYCYMSITVVIFSSKMVQTARVDESSETNVCNKSATMSLSSLVQDCVIWYRSCGHFCHSSSLWLEIEEQLLRLSITLPAKLLQTSSVKNICQLNLNWADYLRVALLPRTWILVSVKNAAPFWERSIDRQLAPVHVWLKMMLRCLLKFSRVEGLMERVGESMQQSVMIHIDVEEDEAEANPSWLHAFKTVLKSNVKKTAVSASGLCSVPVCTDGAKCTSFT